MSKYLVIQDGHFKLKNSVNRIGDYSVDWLKKFDEVIKIAKKEKVKAIIDNGDLFNLAEPNYRAIDEIADRIEKVKIPIFSLYGNHCLLYRNLDSSRYTGLAHLIRRSEYFKYLPEVDFEDMEVIAIDYAHDIEERLKNENLLNFTTDKWRVGFIHAFVTPIPFPYASHVVCDEVQQNGHLMIIGHYHSVWEKKVNDTQYIDIGCFGRNSITESKIEPSCILLDTEKRSYEIIKIKCAKKGEQVFDFTKIEAMKEKNADIDKFVSSLESTNFQSRDITFQIKEIGKQNNVEDAVLDLILNKIKEVEQ